MKQIATYFLILVCFQFSYSQRGDNSIDEEANQEGSFIKEHWELIDREQKVYYDRKEDQIIETDLNNKDFEFKEVYSDYTGISKGKCFNGKVILEPDNVIRKDCPVNDGSYTFQASVLCKPRRSCSYTAYIYFDGDLITSFNVPTNQSLSLSELYSSLDLSGIDTPDDVVLRFCVYRRCVIYNPPPAWPISTSTKVFDHQETMQVRSGGETYKIINDGGGITEHLEDFCILNSQTSLTKLCCNPETEYVIRNDNVTNTSTSAGTTVSAGIKIENKGVVVGSFNWNIYLSASITISDIFTFRSQTTLNADIGECVFLGYQTYGIRRLVSEYAIDCGPNGYDELINEYVDTILTKIETFECETFPDNEEECNDMSDDIIIDFGNGNLLNDEKQHKSIDCTGHINISSLVDGVETYTIHLTGPNDFESTVPDNANLEFGVYQLTVSNGCCDVFEQTIFLCEDQSYGDWSYDSETNLYCRDIICETCNGGEIEDQECVYASYGDFYFDEISLTCNRNLELIDGTIINTESTDADYVDSYNEFWEQCERTYFCGSVEVYDIAENPDFEDWQYDTFWEECIRVVNCFSEEIGEDEGEVSSVTSHGGGYCYLDIFCDGEETYSEEEEEDIEWDYDDFFNECEGTVLCFDEEVDEIEVDPTVESIEFDDFFILCEIEVSCDGSGSFDYTTNPSGVIVGQDEDGNDLCEIYCLGESTGVVITCADVNFSPDEAVEMRSFSEKELSSIQAGPNPFSDQVIIENIPTQRLLTVQVIEMVSGKIIYQKGLISASGYLKLELDHLKTTGIFLLQLRSVDQKVIFENKIIRVY